MADTRKTRSWHLLLATQVERGKQILYAANSCVSSQEDLPVEGHAYLQQLTHSQIHKVMFLALNRFQLPTKLVAYDHVYHMSNDAVSNE